MRVPARWLSAVVAVTMTTGVLVAFSGVATAQAPRAPISGTTIKVGGVVDTLTFAGADDGFKARVERANTKKELGKYKIDYLGSTDAGSSPDKALSIVQSLVERDQVYAVAPVISTGVQ